MDEDAEEFEVEIDVELDVEVEAAGEAAKGLLESEVGIECISDLILEFELELELESISISAKKFRSMFISSPFPNVDEFVSETDEEIEVDESEFEVRGEVTFSS